MKLNSIIHPLLFKSNLKLFIALLAISVLSLQTQAAETPAVNVKMVQAQKQKLSPLMTVPGTVVSRNDGRIAAEVTGRLLEVAEVGTRVEKGDLLARLDWQPLQFQLDENIASVKRLEASLKYQQQQVERLTKLSQTNNTAVNQLDQAVSQRDMVAQDLSKARITQQKTEYQLERSVIRAPFPGQVVERYQQAGEFSSIGKQVVRLVDTTHVEISAQAPVKVAHQLSSNMQVEIEGLGKQQISKIRSIVTVGDERSRNIELRIAIPAGTWVVGAPVKVNLPTEVAREVVTVPRDALILRQDNIYLYKVTDENKAAKVTVQTGIGNGLNIEVIGDIQSGDKVVIRGGERLKDGQSVQDITTQSNKT